MQLCEVVERQSRFPIRQRKANDDILTAHLPPKSLRRPFLRLRSARALDPDKIPVCHVKRPKQYSSMDTSAWLRGQTNTRSL